MARKGLEIRISMQRQGKMKKKSKKPRKFCEKIKKKKENL